MNDPSDRHLDIAGFERCLAIGVPIEFPVDGNPRAAVFVDPATPAIGLRVPDDGSRPDPGLEHLEARTVHRDGARWIEVLVTKPDLFPDGYLLLCAVLDRIQLHGLSVEASLAETVRLIGRLLQRPNEMPESTELGLVGELLAFRQLCCAMRADDVVDAWCGPDAEEHDFAIRDLDLEVKTTQSERRTHWISSLHQLDPMPGRQLWLLSLQLTRTGSSSGTSLPALVSILRETLGQGVRREAFDAKLDRLGWRDVFITTLRTRWRLRSNPHMYLVDASLPRLTPMTLTGAGVSLIHIPDVRYRVDLSGIDPASAVPDCLSPVASMEL